MAGHCESNISVSKSGKIQEFMFPKPLATFSSYFTGSVLPSWPTWGAPADQQSANDEN
jgi:hypothetical protein